MTETKRCTTCGVEKPASEFYRDRRNKSGRYSECRQCVKTRRERDAHKRRAAANALRARDPQTARRKDATYYQAHKDERNEAQRRYRARRKRQGDA